MRSSAKYDGVSLIAVSGFRSVRRQQEIIKNKLDAGRSITEILTANAAPGLANTTLGLRLISLTTRFEKHFDVQTFVSQSPIEALDIAVLDDLTGLPPR